MRTEVDILKSEIKNFEKLEDELSAVSEIGNHIHIYVYIS